MVDEPMARVPAVTDAERRDVFGLMRRLGDLPGRPLLGVTAGTAVPGPPALTELAVAVTVAELRRRIGASFVAPAVVTDEVGAVLDEVAAPLLLLRDPVGGGTARALAGLVIVTGSEGEVSPVDQLAAEARAEEIAVQVLDAGGAGVGMFALAPRLYPATSIELRPEYLRVSGAMPARGRTVFVDLTGSDADSAQHVVTTLARRDDRFVTALRPDGVLLDLLSLVSSAEVVVTDSPGTLVVAVALGRPSIGVAPRLDGPWAPFSASSDELLVAGKSELAERLQGPVQPPPPGLAEQLIGEADAMFDQLSSALLQAGTDRLGGAVAARIDDLIEERATLLAVNAGLHERMSRERDAMAGYVRSLTNSEGGRAAEPGEVAQYQRQAAEQVAVLQDAQAEIERLRAEIARIYATRTMRAVQPARAWYGRLRSRTR